MSMTVVPKKPPRGHKSGKETGILMTVIKTLSSSVASDDRDRDREKAKLEKEYKLSDQRLDGLISRKQDSLNRAIQTFGNICAQIEQARQRLHRVKSGLQKCKMLLHCGRGELEHLWLEGIEHKHALEILEQIDQLRCVTPQYNKLLGRKQYPQVAEVLMNSLGAWNDRLEQIEGLRDAKADLISKKDKLYDILLVELSNELYAKSAPTVVEMKRQGSGHGLFQRASSGRQSSGRNRMNQIKARRIYLIDVPNSNMLSLPDQKPQGDPEDLNAFMNMVVNTIAFLRELPKFIADLKNNLDERFLGCINQISQQIIEYTDSNCLREPGETMFLHLLQLTFNQFRTIVRLHTQLLSFIGKAIQDNNLTIRTYSIADIWCAVQVVLQQTLKIYFDLGDPNAAHQTNVPIATSFAIKEAVDISAYFARKKQPRQKRVPLFRFEYSLHGLNINETAIDHESVDRTMIDKYRFLIFKPNPRNLNEIHNTVQEFISEIEAGLNGQECELRKFMSYNNVEN